MSDDNRELSSNKSMEEIQKNMTEEELAHHLVNRAKNALIPVLEVYEDARKEGLHLKWDGFGLDALGRVVVLNIRIEKHYT